MYVRKYDIEQRDWPDITGEGRRDKRRKGQGEGEFTDTLADKQTIVSKTLKVTRIDILCFALK